MDLSGALKLSKASSPACRIGLLCPPPATPRVWSHLEAIIGTTGAPANQNGRLPSTSWLPRVYVSLGACLGILGRRS